MDLFAEIVAVIGYKPFLCRDLDSFPLADLGSAFSQSAFILSANANSAAAVSWWVSAKRTRSYPYARVYDTLGFSGKKITVIPAFKDEGIRGDRDFLQWNTVSLMSLLGVYVIIAYYSDARRNPRYENKITNQTFDISYIRDKVEEILSLQSDALHWNLHQVGEIAQIAHTALESYGEISNRLGVEMHSRATAERRIETLRKGRDEFISLSRGLAEAAQRRETITEQPKERVAGEKGNLTIHNYLGGFYYLTVDEVETAGDQIHLIEAKHSRGSLPSPSDIKDALIKMALFTNLERVETDGGMYNPVPILKLTGERPFDPDALNANRKRFWETLTTRESRENGFLIRQEHRG